MSLETFVQRLSAAFELLHRRDHGEGDSAGSVRVHPRPPLARPDRLADAPDLGKPEFNEHALTWLDAIHGFALSLTGSDSDAAEDLVQETFLKAFRSWNQFEPGTNCRAWLFRICRNTYLHDQSRASTRHEIPETDLRVDIASGTVRSAHDHADRLFDRPADLFADQLLDDRVVTAIEALPEEYRHTLVLSDLGDLTYSEVAHVLGIPVGTVRSRLFRARQQLQRSLVDYAIEAGYVQGGQL